MDYVLTALEGVATFVSPCLLPLLPLYVAYFAGGSSTGERGSAARTVLCAVCFVLGFGLVFTLMGSFAATLGSLLVRHERLLNVACGLLVMLMGLNYLGVVRVSALNRTWRPSEGVVPRGLASSFVFGVVFAVGWTPCVGTFLASALSLAAASGGVARGAALLACYSVGLGIPFVLTAVLIDQLEGAFAWIKAHYELVNRVSGVMLVALGVLMATGTLGAWLRVLA